MNASDTTCRQNSYLKKKITHVHTIFKTLKKRNWCCALLTVTRSIDGTALSFKAHREHCSMLNACSLFYPRLFHPQSPGLFLIQKPPLPPKSGNFLRTRTTKRVEHSECLVPVFLAHKLDNSTLSLDLGACHCHLL